MTTEDDFQAALDANPEDWQTRLVFADWLQERADPRAEGYRAIAVRRRRPLRRLHLNRGACWWHCYKAGTVPDTSQNVNTIPRDWFALLPSGEGNWLLWPFHTHTGGGRSRRECEDALALAFARLPFDRQAAILDPQRTDFPDEE